jgi:hypothetical protein
VKIVGFFSSTEEGAPEKTLRKKNPLIVLPAHAYIF